MKHPASRELYRYWTAVRGTRPAPDRDDIDPAALRPILADCFILTAAPAAGHPFRIAGTRLCALFGRELKGSSFTELWAGASRPLIGQLLAEVLEDVCGLVLGVQANGRAGEDLALELVVLPLTHRASAEGRILGTLTPLAAPYWLGTEPVGALEVGTFRNLTAGVVPTRGLADGTTGRSFGAAFGGAGFAPPQALGLGRRRPQLTVLPGGRRD